MKRKLKHEQQITQLETINKKRKMANHENINKQNDQTWKIKLQQKQIRWNKIKTKTNANQKKK